MSESYFKGTVSSGKVVEIEFVAGTSNERQDLIGLSTEIAAVAAGGFASEEIGVTRGLRLVVRRRDRFGALEVPGDLIVVRLETFADVHCPHAEGTHSAASSR